MWLLAVLPHKLAVFTVGWSNCTKSELTLNTARLLGVRKRFQWGKYRTRWLEADPVTYSFWCTQDLVSLYVWSTNKVTESFR